MKPNKIFLVRHGESQGNIDKLVYSKIPDYALGLTDKGKAQAIEAGKKLREMSNGRAMFYISSYHRTRQTFEGLAKAFKREDIVYREDPRIIEQSWSGTLRPQGFNLQTERDRDSYGQFYYRFANGESCLEVYTRLSTFLDTLHRDFEKPDYPENAVIVMHGMSMRVFLMRWFHWTVEEFESIRNPKNCDIIVLEREDGGKYRLATELRKHPNYTHSFQAPINLG